MVLFGTFSVTNNLFISADTEDRSVKASDSTINNLTGDQPAIFLDSTYSSDQIKSAFSAKPGQVDTSSAKIKSEVTGEIESKVVELTNQIDAKYEIQSSAGNQIKSSVEPFDVVINVFDKNGNRVDASSAVNSESIKSVADNFEFDASVPQETRDIFIDVYPKLEGVYGPRFGNHKIKIFVDEDLKRSCYSANQIFLQSEHIKYDPVIIHELAHAFHSKTMGYQVWEEGFATAASALIENSRFNELVVEQGYSILNTSNVPYRSFNNDFILMEGYYQWGAATFDKLYLENNDFFRKFNARYYQLVDTERYRTDKYSTIITQIIDQVEGISSKDWVASNYGLTSSFVSDTDGFYALPFYSSDPLLNNDSYNGLWVYTPNCTEYSCDESAKDFNIEILDINGKKLTEMPETNWLRRPSNSDQSYKDYYGMVKVAIAKKSLPDQKHYAYFGKTNSLGSLNISGISFKGGEIAEATNLSTGATASASIKNNMFDMGGPEFLARGRYEVKIYSKKNGCTNSDLSVCKDKLIDTKRLNKGEDRGFVTIGSPKESCSTKITGLKALNRSFQFSTTTNNYCAQTIVLEGGVVRRIFGKVGTHEISELEKSKKYNFSVYSAFSNADLVSVDKTTTTASYDDFTLLKAQDIGIPGKPGYKRRLTFSSAISKPSVQLSVFLIRREMGGDEINFKSTVSFPKSNIIDIAPKTLYFNADYYIDGIDKIKDSHDNPLYKFDYAKSYFMTSLNPKTKKIPSYSDGKKVIDAGNRYYLWSVSKNFSSRKLFSKRDEIRVFPRYFDSNEICAPDNCPAKLSAVVAPNNVSLLFTKALRLNMSYNVLIPWTVTDENNFVSNYYGEFLTKPKNGTKSPTLVSSVPAANSSVKEIPKQIQLTFNNEINDNLDQIMVCSSECLRGEDLKITRSGKTLTVSFNKEFTVSQYSNTVYIYFAGVKDAFGNYISDYELGSLEFLVSPK